MVFFNYATMQMAAKVVYYGPGLCGKTTNLHHIYGRTAPGSRGEMVSLETETDRTLFFDLLPLDVGVIGGFKTRVQLYTVPGQVFYNTTRKLVLKGVDGIVFVADSQRAMREANVESLANLKTNLAEIGVKLDEIPLVLQYNKRDLANILSLEELEASLNPEKLFESYEACAVLGQGVFETLKAISRLTLRSLKKRMLGEEKAPAAPKPAAAIEARRPPRRNRRRRPVPPRPRRRLPRRPTICRRRSTSTPAPSRRARRSSPRPTSSISPRDAFDATDVETVQEFEQALDSLDAPLPEAPAAAAASALRGFAAGRRDRRGDLRRGVAARAGKGDRRRSAPRQGPLQHRHPRGARAPPEDVDLRTRGGREAKPRRPATGISVDDLLASSLNHRKEVSKVFEIQVPRRQLSQGHQVTVGLRFEDKTGKELGNAQSFSFELQSRSDIERLLLSLKFHILGK